MKLSQTTQEGKYKFPVVASLMAFVMFVVLVGLGMWQVQRGAWKHALIAQYNTQSAREPLIALPPIDKAKLAVYNRVALGGKFSHQNSIQVRPRVMNGKQGYDLVTPLVLYTGEVILVLRGFVPDNTKDFIDQPIGTVAVTGILKEFTARDWRPVNDPDKDQWFWIDPEALAKKFNYTGVYPLLLVSDVKPLNTPYPDPQPLAPAFTDNHYMYAGIWFTLAIILVIIYLRSQTRKVDLDAVPEHSINTLPKDAPRDDDTHGSGGTGDDPLR